LDSGFSPVLSSFRVNTTLQGDQHRAQVAALSSGGAAFVWQGGPQGFEHIYARFLSPSNVWATGEVLVNTTTNRYQGYPALAQLAGGNVAFVWTSVNQAGSNSMQDVYAQVLTPTGQKVGGEVLVNQFTSSNQRDPAVAALADGRFVVVWISEQQRAGEFLQQSNNPVTYGTVSVDAFARLFTSNGVPASPEMLVNTSSSLCSSPKVAGAADGRFMVTWTEQDRAHGPNGMDIWARLFSSSGSGGAVLCVNTTLRGDQYLPTISADSSDYFIGWTGLGQDGSYEGVFGQFLRYDGTKDGGEIQLNTTWVSHQFHPVVASDTQGRFLSVWTSFGGGVNSYDLYAQRFVNVAVPLPAMNAPFVYVPFPLATSVVYTNGHYQTNHVYQPELQVSWPFQLGFSLDHYEVYVDGSATAAVSTTTNVWLMAATNGLSANSTHSFSVCYVTTTGRRSPLSPLTYATTYSSGNNWGGIASDWMASYYGSDFSSWPSAGSRVAPGGPTLLQVFLTGANPYDSSTWLRLKMANTPQGEFLTFNPQPGLTYQVQTSSNLTSSSWLNLGPPRFAAGTIDSLYVGSGSKGYYRVQVLY
jgi:hypothetical protein